MPQLRQNYTLTLEGDEVGKLRELLASIPISVSTNYTVDLRRFHQELYELLRVRS